MTNAQAEALVQRAADDSDPLWIREACSVMFCKNKPAHMPSDSDHIHFSITQLIVWCLMCQIMVNMSIIVPKGQESVLKCLVLSTSQRCSVYCRRGVEKPEKSHD